MAGRRREQATEVFRERYRRRSGIEGTNSGLKRRLGLGRLRVRGRPRVFQAIYLKVAGWNILRAAACATMRELVWAKARTPVFRLSTWVRTTVVAPDTSPTAAPGYFRCFIVSFPTSAPSGAPREPDFCRGHLVLHDQPAWATLYVRQENWLRLAESPWVGIVYSCWGNWLCFA